MSPFVKNCTGVILAGGENSRMPVPKALIRVHGRPIIENNLRIMRQLFMETVIITNKPELYSFLDARMAGDIYDIRGPATGILSAMLNCGTGWIFVSACDMPYLNGQLIAHMASMRKGHDAVVPKHRRRVEPLMAFYSCRLAPSIDRALQSGRRGMKDFLKTKRVQYVPSGKLRQYGSPEDSFRNLNTPEDVERFLEHNDILTFKESLRRSKCSA